MPEKTAIAFGVKVRDTVTDFTGILTGRYERLKSPPLLMIEGLDSGGRTIEWWCAEERIIELNPKRKLEPVGD